MEDFTIEHGTQRRSLNGAVRGSLNELARLGRDAEKLPQLAGYTDEQIAGMNRDLLRGVLRSA